MPADGVDATYPRLAVGAVIVRDGRLLMVQRANEPGKGLWSVPGGRVERGEYLADALRREVMEETSLEIEVGELLGMFEVVGHDAHYVVLDFIASVGGGNAPRAGGDAADAAWVPLDDVARRDCTPRFVETLRGWGVL